MGSVPLKRATKSSALVFISQLFTVPVGLLNALTNDFETAKQLVAVPFILLAIAPVVKSKLFFSTITIELERVFETELPKEPCPAAIP